MVSTFYIITLFLIQIRFLHFLNITINPSLSNCEISNDDFWYIFQKHFSLVSFMTITILQTREHFAEINQITEEFLKILCENYYKRNLYQTITIKENIYTNQKSSSRFYNDFQNIKNEIDNNLYSLCDQDFIKAKLRTTDSSEGFTIIVWHPENIEAFLNETLLVPRVTYMILFVFSFYQDCKSFEIYLDKILKRFWTDFNILNLIAQTPCSCNKIYIYRPFLKKKTWGRIQAYNPKQVIKNIALTTNPLFNLNKYPLRISLFERSPTAIRNLPKNLQNNPIYQNVTSSKGFAGSDGLLLGALVEYLNFEPVIDENLEPFSYGYVFRNGTVSGVLADIVNRRSDYAGNCRLMTYFRTEGHEFIKPYSSERISMAVPKSAKVPRWRSLFNCFNKLSWSLILGICVFCCGFWWLIRCKSLIQAFWEMFSFFVGIPCKMVPSKGQFLFLTSCMMFNIIILGVIQGSFFTDFTTTLYYPDLNTLEEVVESGLPIMSFAWQILSIGSSPLDIKLKKNSIPYEDNVYELIALYRNVAVLDRRLDMELLVKTKYLGHEGVSPLHIVEENLATFLTTGLVPKGSPFLIVFNYVITSMFEAGLTKKWYNDVVDSMVIEHKHKIEDSEEFEPFSLEDIQAAFYVIAFGYCGSVFVFLCEIFFKCRYFKIYE